MCVKVRDIPRDKPRAETFHGGFRFRIRGGGGLGAPLVHTESRVEGTVGATGLPKAMSRWCFSVPGCSAWGEEKERDTVMSAKVCNLEERGECSDIYRVFFKGVPACAGDQNY